MGTRTDRGNMSEEMDECSDDEVVFPDGRVKFSEVWDPIAAIRWILRIESVFKAMKCAEKDKVVYGVNLLRAEARVWWDRVQDAIGSRTATEMTWSEFKEAFKDEFYPITMELELVEQGKRTLRRQGRNESLVEYATRYEKLWWFFWEYLSFERRNKLNFVCALLPDIKDFISTEDMTTLDSIVEAAKAIEEENNRRLQGQYVPKRRRERRMCRNCGTDHWGGECRYGSMGCNRCGKSSHLARQCPSL